jgi:pSer/pThr/pTyr-binding forkhead associated (FHA) protein
VTEKHSDHASGEATADITSAFRANLFEPDPPTTARAQCADSGIHQLPSGSALLVVTRGPNAGSRFVLGQPITSVGRHPNSDIFCDDITVSRRHAEFRRQNSEFQVVDVGSLNGTYVNREPVQSAVARLTAPGRASPVPPPTKAATLDVWTSARSTAGSGANDGVSSRSSS